MRLWQPYAGCHRAGAPLQPVLYRPIGVVGEYLSSDYSLAETRVLYEITHREQPIASQIAEGLRLDRGYLSRILRRFHKDGLLARTRSGKDAGRGFSR
jgi:DNA-binding MarR family transcriptional regulator